MPEDTSPQKIRRERDMDEDLARIIATAGIQASSQLTDLVAFLAHYLPDDRQLRLGIATAITQIDSSVVRPAFAAAPALEIEFDKRLERYGRFT